MVGDRIPDVPSKGFFLNQFWSNFYPQKKATEKHQKSFDPPVDQVLKKKKNLLFDANQNIDAEAGGRTYS